MKKMMFGAFVALSVLLISCGGKNNTEQTDTIQSDSVEVVCDSTSNDNSDVVCDSVNNETETEAQNEVTE